jgi:thiosulfate reductase cytochrome b subunit
MQSMAKGPLVYRHNRVTRLTHWVNALGLMILFMSGLMIFNAHPHLYWGHTSEPEKTVLSIAADESASAPRGYVEVLGQRLDTTGVLGVQQSADGPRQRAFPSWLTIPGYYSLATARRWHFFFGWFFTINGLLYIGYNLAVGHMRKFLFTPRDAAKVPAMIAYYVKLRKTSPSGRRIQPAAENGLHLRLRHVGAADFALRHGDVAAVKRRLQLAPRHVRRPPIGAHDPFHPRLRPAFFRRRPCLHGRHSGFFQQHALDDHRLVSRKVA